MDFFWYFFLTYSVSPNQKKTIFSQKPFFFKINSKYGFFKNTVFQKVFKILSFEDIIISKYNPLSMKNPWEANSRFSVGDSRGPPIVLLVYKRSGCNEISRNAKSFKTK